MSIREMFDEKKQWRAHMARVKALPNDYQIVYREIQKYLFKVGPVLLTGDQSLLSDLVDLFEQGATAEKSVLEVTGTDVAAFADGLIDGLPTYADAYQPGSDAVVAESMKVSIEKEYQKSLKKEGKHHD